jgi:hypothetical protein
MDELDLIQACRLINASDTYLVVTRAEMEASMNDLEEQIETLHTLLARVGMDLRGVGERLDCAQRVIEAALVWYNQYAMAYSPLDCALEEWEKLR